MIRRTFLPTLITLGLLGIPVPVQAQTGKQIRIAIANSYHVFGAPVRVRLVYVNRESTAWQLREPEKTYQAKWSLTGPDGKEESFRFGPVLIHRQVGEGHWYMLEPSLKEITIGPGQRYMFDTDLWQNGSWLWLIQPGRLRLKVLYEHSPWALSSNTVELRLVFTTRSVPYMLALLRHKDTATDDRRYAIAWLARFKTDFTVVSRPETDEEWAENQKAIDDFAVWWKKHRNTPEVARIIRGINEAAKHVPPYVPPVPQDVALRLARNPHPCQDRHTPTQSAPPPQSPDASGSPTGAVPPATDLTLRVALYLLPKDAKPLICGSMPPVSFAGSLSLTDAIVGQPIGLALQYRNETPVERSFPGPFQTCNTILLVTRPGGKIERFPLADDHHQAQVIEYDHYAKQRPTEYFFPQGEYQFLCDLSRRWPETLGPGTYTLQVVDEAEAISRISNPVTLQVRLTTASIDHLIGLLRERFVTVTGRRHAAAWLAKFNSDFTLILDPQTPADHAANRKAIDAFARWWKTHRQSPATQKILADINAPLPGAAP